MRVYSPRSERYEFSRAALVTSCSSKAFSSTSQWTVCLAYRSYQTEVYGWEIFLIGVNSGCRKIESPLSNRKLRVPDILEFPFKSDIFQKGKHVHLCFHLRPGAEVLTSRGFSSMSSILTCLPLAKNSNNRNQSKMEFKHKQIIPPVIKNSWSSPGIQPMTEHAHHWFWVGPHLRFLEQSVCEKSLSWARHCQRTGTIKDTRSSLDSPE